MSALNPLLKPKSIAVVGVSMEPNKVGHQIFVNLQSFDGPVYPINPKHKRILGREVFPDVLSIPEHIDLVIIVTPAQTVEAICDQCIDKKVKAIIIVSAGFAETSKAGREIQDRIASKLAHNNIVLLGPNCLGALNPHHKLNASFAPAIISKGGIALISQSGAILTSIFSSFAGRQVGCSFALSLGNSAGVNVTDALEYALFDPHTKVVGVYVESLPQMREFFALCKQLSNTKPVILLKGGTTTAGQTASLSHTAALATDSSLLHDASYQAGFVYTQTIEQFVETLVFIDTLYTQHESLPNNLMILTNAGGPGVNSVDFASQNNVPLAAWSKASTERFGRLLPRVHPNNPTDLIGDASVADFEAALAIADEADEVGSILLIITEQAVTDVPGLTKLLVERAKKKKNKPLIVALMGGESLHKYRKILREEKITVVEYANEGVEIFAYTEHARLAQFVDRSAQILSKLEKKLPSVPISRLAFPLQNLNIAGVLTLLENYGFTLPRTAIVTDELQLQELEKLRPENVFPLIAKTGNLGLKHKAAVGALVKDISNIEETKKAYQDLQKFGNQLVLQETIENAQEVILGGKRNNTYGTFIAIGSGGSLTNIIADRAYIFLPASQREIRKAFARTKIISELSNEQQQLVLLAIEHLIKLFNEHQEIAELEINPLMVTADTAYAADVKVELTGTL
ncbi:MAG TPA: CoA-binding protein [Patescibacteria group bacterium]|nr:CoA-binding protein [Patescibacteria group bacterium]